MKKITCRKCLGNGIIPNYKHVEEGICFQCHGSGFEEVEDDVTDIVQEMRKQKVKDKENRKEFEALYKQYEKELPNNWMWYISRETKNVEEQLERLNKYIAFKKEKEVYKKSIDISNIDIDEMIKHIKEIESKYFEEV
jgi:hypothetical protein